MSDSTPASAPAVNTDFTWLEFIKANKGQGFSRDELSQHYRTAKGLPPKAAKVVKTADAVPAIPAASTTPAAVSAAPVLPPAGAPQAYTVEQIRQMFEAFSTEKSKPKIKSDRKLSAYQEFTKEYYAKNPELGKLPMKERTAEVVAKWKEHKESNAKADAPAAPVAEAAAPSAAEIEAVAVEPGAA